MRIHTDHHTAESIRAALRIAQDAGLIHPGVIVAKLDEHGSRSRRRAYEVQLGAPSGTPSFLAADGREYLTNLITGYGGDPDSAERAARRAARRFSRNGYGTAPADSPMTATWHEWGYFLAALFAADGDMSTGPYSDSYDFAVETAGERVPAWAIADPAGRVEQGRVADFLTAVGDLPDAISAATPAAA